MNSPDTPVPPSELLAEIDARMAQALGNFFQRSRAAIQENVLQAIASDMTPSTLAIAQLCLDWLNAYPDRLSSAFAGQFRQQLTHPGGLARAAANQTGELQLVDDSLLTRQLAEDKAAQRMTEFLRPELLLLFGRVQTLRHAALEAAEHAEGYGPLAVVRALTAAFDALKIDKKAGTLLLQASIPPLRDALKHIYNALNQFLESRDVEVHTAIRALPEAPARRAGPVVGEDILAHIRSVAAAGMPPAAHLQPPAAAAAGPTSGAPAPQAPAANFQQALTQLQRDLPPPTLAPAGLHALVLHQLQQEARHTDAGAFDLAMLDAVTALFEYLLDDPDVSPHYKSAIAQLQIPVLRVALESPDFFADDSHPARQLLDLLGSFSRRFPEANPLHRAALVEVQSACDGIIAHPDRPAEMFAQARHALADWQNRQDATAEASRASEIARLEAIEQQELGTLLALENLQDLTERHPAPESVLRQLEMAWVPHMASLYVAEAGEGPQWRAAGETMLQLFLSLQAPENDAERELRLQSIPRINSALRQGLLAQGAIPDQLRDFFGAITATQECWVRPTQGNPEIRVSRFTPQPITHERIAALASELPALTEPDAALEQARQLLEGDWVDFDPPYEGLSTARVAWVGVQGYMLFCDSLGEQRFPLDAEQLAAEIRAGRAHIPEQSLTRKAMLRLRSQLSSCNT